MGIRLPQHLNQEAVSPDEDVLVALDTVDVPYAQQSGVVPISIRLGHIL